MHRILLVPTLAAALCAGEPATAAPLTLGVADGAQLQQHWNASLYAKVWNDPGLAKVRQQWADQKAAWKTLPGVDVDALLAAAKGIRFEFLGVTPQPNAKPRLRMQAELGAQAKPLFDLLAQQLPNEQRVPGADAARSGGADGPVLARFGSTLVFAWNAPVATMPVAPQQPDLHLSMDYGTFMKAISQGMSEPQRSDMERMTREMQAFMGTLVWDTVVKPTGLYERITYDKPTMGLMPVDRALLDRFPANSLAAMAIAMDAAALWKIVGPTYLDSIDQAMHRGQRLGREQTQTEIDAILAGLGVAGGLQQLVGDITGTVACAITPSAPFPAVSFVVPRSPSIDALIGSGLAALGTTAPAEGASTILPIPKLPIMVTLARDRGHWLVTSDALLVENWLAGKSGGFLASPAGAAMAAKSPQGSYFLGAVDTAAAMRTAIPFITMGMSMARQMPNDVRQAIMAGLNRFAAESGPSWMYGIAKNGSMLTEAEGPLGAGLVPMAAIGAAIAIPNLLESRIAANEAAASATLKSGIFPAQIQFQAGAYVDQDGDNVGEYGTLAELSGRQATGKVEAGTIKLVMGPLAQSNHANGYQYRIYLPDGAGGTLDSDDAVRVALPKAANDQERYFLVIAWPDSPETGRRMFALGQDGQVRSQRFDGIPPEWRDVLPAGWGSEPAWSVHERGGRQGRQRKPVEDVPASDGQGMF